MIQIPKVTYDKIEVLRNEGYKYREIAAKLGTTINVVKKTIYEHNHPEKKVERSKRENRAYNKREKGSGIEVPGTDIVLTNNVYAIENAVGKLGDDKVNAFITYHLEMLKMRQGVDMRNVPELYERFVNYLKYCAEHNIMPNNSNAYFAIGVSKKDISSWYTGKTGSAAHKQFATDVKAFFSSIHEQGAVEGLINPILGIWWQKAYDGMIEAQKVEQINEEPLGERASAESIAAKWAEADVQLPDD